MLLTKPTFSTSNMNNNAKGVGVPPNFSQGWPGWGFNNSKFHGLTLSDLTLLYINAIAA
jgi:hypothetical protein